MSCFRASPPLSDDGAVLTGLKNGIAVQPVPIMYPHDLYKIKVSSCTLLLRLLLLYIQLTLRGANDMHVASTENKGLKTLNEGMSK